ncbi:hypothetical protein P7E02_10590 [Enterococcus hulanensis]|uniref:hypothetical protein n=1 Tax=Enterococcus hulanensis TaxID=2559929 RepID=UPI00289210B9|nr:hypothetical protein [Enterococcus hulanensis]MDT2660320.1 hypothetical protein [Enterococcus hulanensis]
MYFKGNSKINKIIQATKKERGGFEFDSSVLVNLFNKRIIKIYDAHIIENVGERISTESIKDNFEELICMNTDLTGYECSANEFRVIDAFEEINFSLSPMQQFILGKVIMENLITKKNFPIPSVVYFTFDEDKLSMRFHKYRPNEGFWVSSELENYEEPVGYFFIDTAL